ncbi:MAG TPA: EamA family transporter [Candidatus Limnocylindrales bacterium]|nr:EamA family transporter [Candidatus Limnocylindrales bacterium]
MTDIAEPIPGVRPARVRHAPTGYALYLLAAVLFAVNGTVAKTLLLGGIEPSYLSQLRATLAFVVLLVFVALRRPSALRLRRAEIPLLLVYGVLGIAATQFLYFAAIERLPIGITLLIEFTAPLWVAVWFAVAWKHPTKPIVWIALVVALAGLAIVGQVWEGLTLDPVGILFAVGAMVALVVYYLSADIAMQRPDARDPVSLTMWGMGAAALAWAIAQPLWTFPVEVLSTTIPFGGSGPELPATVLAAWMVVMGTVLPFSLVVLSMQHLRASQASAVGMTEPIFAIGVAWVVLGETLSVVQLVGAVIVLGAVLVAELNRGETAPAPTGEAAAGPPGQAPGEGTATSITPSTTRTG